LEEPTRSTRHGAARSPDVAAIPKDASGEVNVVNVGDLAVEVRVNGDDSTADTQNTGHLGDDLARFAYVLEYSVGNAGIEGALWEWKARALGHDRCGHAAAGGLDGVRVARLDHDREPSLAGDCHGVVADAAADIEVTRAGPHGDQISNTPLVRREERFILKEVEIRPRLTVGDAPIVHTSPIMACP
jgi:hypothetical protein